MSTLAEIEKVVPQFSVEELAELEQFIRKARREKEHALKPSLRDIEPVSVGTILEPVGTRDEWYDEMLGGPGVTHGLDTSFLVAVEIMEHAQHAEALRLLGELLARGDYVAIAPQVLAEFVHVVTDARRFHRPFSMETALSKPDRWWNAAETEQVLAADVAVARFHNWMRHHQLGRKRVLDTLLAATYHAAGVTSLLTLDAADFTVFGEFACLPAALP